MKEISVNYCRKNEKNDKFIYYIFYNLCKLVENRKEQIQKNEIWSLSE